VVFGFFSMKSWLQVEARPPGWKPPNSARVPASVRVSMIVTLIAVGLQLGDDRIEMRDDVDLALLHRRDGAAAAADADEGGVRRASGRPSPAGRR
jgi:hypothetical protein